MIFMKKCPYCKKEVEHKKKHIKRHHPNIYEKIQANTNKEEKNYSSNSNQKKKRFKHICVQCGNCCRQGWDIPVLKEDLSNWIQVGKDSDKKFLRHIQLDPKSISYEGIRGGVVNVKNEVEKRKAIEDFLEREKKFNTEDYNRKVIRIYNFVLDNHIYKGQGKPIYYNKKMGYRFTFPQVFGVCPIFIPNTFNTIIEGWKLGLNYILLYRANDHCSFLKENKCSIHEIKPTYCKIFPFDHNGELKVNDTKIRVCRGLISYSNLERSKQFSVEI